MSEYIDLLLDKQSHMSYTSEKFPRKIVSWIKKSYKVSKEELIDKLGWGRGIKWTPYRRSLMKTSKHI